MKNFKQLAEQINLHEGEHTFGGGFNNINQNYAAASAYSDEGVYQIEKKSQLNRINAFLDAFSRKEYMDPRAALGLPDLILFSIRVQNSMTMIQKVSTSSRSNVLVEHLVSPPITILARVSRTPMG